MDCANLRPDGEYLRPEETEPPVDFPFGDVATFCIFLFEWIAPTYTHTHTPLLDSWCFGVRWAYSKFQQGIKKHKPPSFPLMNLCRQ